MVELKLDTAAVNALFPEGTQARVNLQQAVINNITSSILDKRANKDVQEQIRIAAEEHGMKSSLPVLVQTELRKYLTERGWNNTSVRLQNTRAQEVRSLVEAEVRGITHTLFEDIIKQCADDAKQRFKDGIERKIAYALANSEAHFAARLNDGFKEILDKALADRLGLAVKS